MKYIVVLWLMCPLKPLFGQDILSVLITLDYTNAKAKTVFQSIHTQSGAIFSYGDFNDEQLITIKAEKLPLKQVISKLEKELNVDVTIKEKYLIVRYKIQKDIPEVKIDGTVIDPNSSEPLSDASVFVKKHKILVNTDDQGKFAFRVPGNTKMLKINIAKANYIDTSVIIVVSRDQNLHIAMRSFPRQKISEFDSLSKKEITITPEHDREPIAIPEVKAMTYNDNFWERQRKKNINLINITDTLLNTISISLLPPISTNKLLSYNTRNNVSINIIGGNSKGINGVEAGGVYNYTDGDVKGVQVAGVMNLVSENVIGTQVSGVFNGVRGDVKGAQVAGVVNLNDKTTDGIQVAGVGQHTKHLIGVQVAGIYNVAHTAKGMQISGITNIVDSATTHLQISGIYNKAASIKGLQISGIANHCDTLEGIQIGLFNRCNHIKGGFAVGLFNYVKDGYNKLELSYNDLGTASIGYRSGWAPLHMHYFVGGNWQNSDHRFLQAGAGLASSIPLSKSLHLQADINTRQYYDADRITNYSFHMHNQALLGISWQLGKKFGIRTGLTLNHLWYEPSSSLNSHIASLAKNEMYSTSSENRLQKIWPGWHVGILLF